MNPSQLLALAKEFAKNLKTDADLNEFSKALKKLTVETALNVELTKHLGHEHNYPSAKGNTRNGYSKKQVLTSDGEFELNTPRERVGSIESEKHCFARSGSNKPGIPALDCQILSWYAKSMIP